MSDNIDNQGYSFVGGWQAGIGTPLQQILNADSIQPGSSPSYELCKLVYTYHPLGAKIVETPVKIAQSQARIITLENAPEQDVRDAFEREWQAIKADYFIRGTMFVSRIYGSGVLIYGSPDVPTDQPIDPFDLPKLDLYFNILDPLNTAGSLVLDQNSNSPTFMKPVRITAAGEPYHPSRSCIMFNEQPVFLSYTDSAFGFNGRSVFQRALFPLKSFINSMVTDDMVTRKAGLLVAMLKNAGSIVNRIMQLAASIKRNILKEAATNNVLSIDVDEKIESINLQNTDTAMTVARKNILNNIATAADMPAQLLENETFAEGFGEGTEDTKNIIRYVNGVRAEMRPMYDFMDRIVMHRAWSPEFYETIQAKYPEQYGDVEYKAAFYQWKEAFKATWPSLLEEPESEQAKQDKVRLEGLVSVYEVLNQGIDPENKARLVDWVMDNLNEYKKLFRVSLELDSQALAEYEPPMPTMFNGETPDSLKGVR